jgi:hypothetical protein
MLIPGTHMIPAGNGRSELACSMARDGKPKPRAEVGEREAAEEEVCGGERDD